MICVFFALVKKWFSHDTVTGPIDPDYAGLLYKDLKKAEEPLVVSTYLHLLYLVTPYDMVKDLNPSWLIYFTQVYIILNKNIHTKKQKKKKKTKKKQRKQQQEQKKKKTHPATSETGY